MYRSARMFIALIFIGVFNSLPAMTIEKMAKWKSLLNQNNPEIVAQFYNTPGGHEAVKAVFKELNHEAQVTIVCWLAIQKASKSAGLPPTTQELAQQIADLAPLSPRNPILTDDQKRSLHIGFFIG